MQPYRSTPIRRPHCSAGRHLQTVAETAAKLCSNLNTGGYSDWYLPSKDELNKLYLQKMLLGGFKEVCYWSSSETGKYNACSQIFDSGFQTANDKSTPLNVRPIRSF